MEPRMPFEPGADLGMLVRGVIVDDQVQLPPGRGLAVDLIEEADELLMAVAGHALADDLAFQHVERGEQCRRAVADVIMGHRPASAALHWQPRLGAGERLNLRLLVYPQPQRVLRRIDIKADDILDLGGKLRIVRQLESAHPVRLQPMRRPDPLNAAMADPGGFRHRSAGPVHGLARRFGERHLDHPLYGLRRQRRLARRPGRLVQQALHALGHKARLPAPDRRLAFAGLPLDRHCAHPIATQQDNPSPPHMLLRAVPRSDHGLQPLAITRSKPDFNAFSHPARLAYPRAYWNYSSAPIH